MRKRKQPTEPASAALMEYIIKQKKKIVRWEPGKMV